VGKNIVGLYITIGVLILLLAGAGYYLFSGPSSTELRRLTTEIQESQERVQQEIGNLQGTIERINNSVVSISATNGSIIEQLRYLAGSQQRLADGIRRNTEAISGIGKSLSDIKLTTGAIEKGLRGLENSGLEFEELIRQFDDTNSIFDRLLSKTRETNSSSQ